MAIKEDVAGSLSEHTGRQLVQLVDEELLVLCPSDVVSLRGEKV